MGNPKKVEINEEANTVKLDDILTPNSDPAQYPIYKGKEALAPKYSCFVYNGKLI